MRKALLASVSAIALGCSATVPARATPPTPMTWTGFYVGANAGYAWGHSDTSLLHSAVGPPLFLSGTLADPPGLNPRGFIGGGQAGYNWQTGQWVFGGEVDFSGLSAKADASISPFFTGKGPNTVTWASQYDWLFTARVRGGFLVVPNWLLYATGGLAVTHVRDSVTCTVPPGGNNDCINNPPFGNLNWSSSSTLTGGTFGGGVETMFAPNWTARAEYLYAKFQDTSPSSTIPAVPPFFSFSHNLNIVRFAINYKFGG